MLAGATPTTRSSTPRGLPDGSSRQKRPRTTGWKEGQPSTLADRPGWGNRKEGLHVNDGHLAFKSLGRLVAHDRLRGDWCGVVWRPRAVRLPASGHIERLDPAGVLAGHVLRLCLRPDRGPLRRVRREFDRR